MKQVVAALIVRENKILICQRTRHQTMPLKWEFPGGKIEPGEKPEEALRRELEEELGILATVGSKVATIAHTYGNGGMVELHFFLVQKFTGEIENRIFRDVRWVGKNEMPDYDFLEADVGLVRDLANGKIRIT
jgi:8-oxo-dGTP diphosphatase